LHLSIFEDETVQNQFTLNHDGHTNGHIDVSDNIQSENHGNDNNVGSGMLSDEVEQMNTRVKKSPEVAEDDYQVFGNEFTLRIYNRSQSQTIVFVSNYGYFYLI
jgi:hypothetical protein